MYDRSMRNKEGIPQFKTLEEEKAYWESKGPFGVEAQREGIAKTFSERFDFDCIGKWCNDKRCKDYNDTCGGCFADRVIEVLHAQGVVLDRCPSISV